MTTYLISPRLANVFGVVVDDKRIVIARVSLPDQSITTAYRLSEDHLIMIGFGGFEKQKAEQVTEQSQIDSWVERLVLQVGVGLLRNEKGREDLVSITLPVNTALKTFCVTDKHPATDTLGGVRNDLLVLEEVDLFEVFLLHSTAVLTGPVITFTCSTNHYALPSTPPAYLSVFKHETGALTFVGTRDLNNLWKIPTPEPVIVEKIVEVVKKPASRRRKPKVAEEVVSDQTVEASTEDAPLTNPF
jgi:hypothetical protein